MFHTTQLILHLYRLGLAINWKKSSPHPLQRGEYLEVVLDSEQQPSRAIPAAPVPLTEEVAGWSAVCTQPDDDHVFE